YRTIPHDMGRQLRRLRVPGGFVGGEHSEVARRTGLATTRRRFALRTVPGGHLFPFEHPAAAAAAVMELADTLLQ
ncbi:MAG: alpha/beta hydrolase, partial [Burkholderiales bacterium]